MTNEESAKFVVKQSPQDFVDWLKNYHNRPLHIALQRPVGVPTSWALNIRVPELGVTEPATSNDGTPLLVELFDDEVAAIAIVFDLTLLLDGHTQVSVTCSMEKWSDYFHKLIDVLQQPDTATPSQGNKTTESPMPTGDWKPADEERLKKVREVTDLSQTRDIKVACDMVGIDDSTFRKWRKRYSNYL